MPNLNVGFLFAAALNLTSAGAATQIDEMQYYPNDYSIKIFEYLLQQIYLAKLSQYGSASATITDAQMKTLVQTATSDLISLCRHNDPQCTFSSNAQTYVRLKIDGNIDVAAAEINYLVNWMAMFTSQWQKAVSDLIGYQVVATFYGCSSYDFATVDKGDDEIMNYYSLYNCGCRAGYYGSITKYLQQCQKCPSPGTSKAGTNAAITDCYIASSPLPKMDETGTFTISDGTCYYTD